MKDYILVILTVISILAIVMMTGMYLFYRYMLLIGG